MPEAPGVIVGDDTPRAMSARRGPAVTVVGAAVLFADDGSVVVDEAEADPPDTAPGAVDGASDTGRLTDVVPVAATLPATVHVTVPDESVQPDGKVPTMTPDGGVYVNVIGPTASDGPSFVAVTTTVPEVPGVIVGVDTVATMSALRAPTVTVVGVTVLLAVAGSVEAVLADADPPDTVPGEAEAGIDTGRLTDVVPVAATLPATVQVTVPDAIVQPDGSVPSTTPGAGVYVNVVGPTASDGPSFVAVIVTVPDVPGVIVGDDTVVTTSARRVPEVRLVGETVLFAVAGSLVVVVAEPEPPVTVSGACEAASETVIATEVDEPEATSPAIVQVTVPEVLVQPDGSVPTVTPDGGV